MKESQTSVKVTVQYFATIERSCKDGKVWSTSISANSQSELDKMIESLSNMMEEAELQGRSWGVA